MSPARAKSQSANALARWTRIAARQRLLGARKRQRGRVYTVTCTCGKCKKCGHRASKAKYRKNEREHTRRARAAEMRHYRRQISANEWDQGIHTRRAWIPFRKALAVKEAELWAMLGVTQASL